MFVSNTIVNWHPTNQPAIKDIFISLFKMILIPVIPLEDLPELQVGYGFGLVDKENVPKPDFLKVTHKDNNFDF